MGLSTHILDTAAGRPAAGVAVQLAILHSQRWQTLGSGQTDVDGRCRTLLGDTPLTAATFQLRFETAPYFERLGLRSLYPFVEIVFTVDDPAAHFHIPLLLAANGYTTYRGS